MLKNSLQFGLNQNLQEQAVFGFEEKVIFNNAMGQLAKYKTQKGEGGENETEDKRKERIDALDLSDDPNKKPDKILTDKDKEALHSTVDQALEELKNIPGTKEHLENIKTEIETAADIMEKEESLTALIKNVEKLLIKSKEGVKDKKTKDLSTLELEDFDEKADSKTIKAYLLDYFKVQIPDSFQNLFKLFNSADFKNNHTFQAVTTMAHILSLKDNAKDVYPWVNSVEGYKEGALNLEALKTQVDLVEANGIEKDAKKSVQEQIDDALKNEDSILLQTASEMFGKDTMNRVLQDRGLLGMIARMILGLSLDFPDAKQMNKGNDIFDTILDKKGNESIKLSYLGKKEKDGSIKKGLFTKTLAELKSSNKTAVLDAFLQEQDLHNPDGKNVERKATAHLFNDLQYRFGDHLDEGGPQSLKMPTDEEDGSVVLNAKTPLQAAAIKRFYNSAISKGLSIKDLMSTFKKDGKASDKMANALTSVVANDPYQEAKGDRLPALVTADVVGTQVTLRWSKSGILDKMKAVFSSNKDDKKKNKSIL